MTWGLVSVNTWHPCATATNTITTIAWCPKADFAVVWLEGLLRNDPAKSCQHCQLQGNQNVLGLKKCDGQGSQNPPGKLASSLSWGWVGWVLKIMQLPWGNIQLTFRADRNFMKFHHSMFSFTFLQRTYLITPDIHPNPELMNVNFKVWHMRFQKCLVSTAEKQRSSTGLPGRHCGGHEIHAPHIHNSNNLAWQCWDRRHNSSTLILHIYMAHQGTSNSWPSLPHISRCPASVA